IDTLLHALANASDPPPAFSIILFYNHTATTEIYTFPYTTLFRSFRLEARLGWSRPGYSRRLASRASRNSGSASAYLPWVLSTNRSEEHTSELQSLAYLVCRLLLEKKKTHLGHFRHITHYTIQP